MIPVQGMDLILIFLGPPVLIYSYNKNPTSHGRSGYYVLKTDHLFFAYCEMELDCGGNKGGWMQIADFKKGNTCPGIWTNDGSYCTGGSSAGCYSADFSTNSTSYSKLCGKVKGYQKGTMDAFFPFAHAHGNVNGYMPSTTSRSLDGVYVAGISITSGNPRKHVWTYAVGLSDDYNYTHANCPCVNTPDQILLYLLAITIIVSLVILEHMNMLLYTVVTHYGMEQVVYLKTVVAMMLECHGSSINSL